MASGIIVLSIGQQGGLLYSAGSLVIVHLQVVFLSELSAASISGDFFTQSNEKRRGGKHLYLDSQSHRFNNMPDFGAPGLLDSARFRSRVSASAKSVNTSCGERRKITNSCQGSATGEVSSLQGTLPVSEHSAWTPRQNWDYQAGA
ncbi:hypothetical protein B0H66DRAFT_526973 [Apodospora peruviana]|uniref:Uncharacterized protein n=1 Tax=Apodospora peruviana TaxID=516989 RepID=A0AAE0IRA1_9PEZI|nr:hypothetical protein B0H66DRAFT_526973 [Apodospora peruviana]